MDLPGFDVDYAAAGAGTPSGGPMPPHTRSATRATRIAATLVAGLCVPGLALIVIAIFLLDGSSDDLLSPVIGMVGLVVLAVGILVVLNSVVGAVALWRRQPRARLQTIVLGGTFTLVGPVTGLAMGGAVGFLLAIGLFAYGGVLVWLLLVSPGARADFPGPLLAASRRRG